MIKISPNFVRTVFMSEILRVYTMQQAAEACRDALNEKKDVDVSIAEVHTDGIVFRKKRECEITDRALLKQMAKAMHQLITADTTITDRILDNYNLKYSKSCLTEDGFDGVLIISRSGRLITVEFDV